MRMMALHQAEEIIMNYLTEGNFDVFLPGQDCGKLTPGVLRTILRATRHDRKEVAAAAISLLGKTPMIFVSVCEPSWARTPSDFAGLDYVLEAGGCWFKLSDLEA